MELFCGYVLDIKWNQLMVIGCACNGTPLVVVGYTYIVLWLYTGHKMESVNSYRMCIYNGISCGYRLGI